MSIAIRPSRIGLLPCVIILLLWLVLPPPQIPASPAVDPQTRQAAIRAQQHASKARHLRTALSPHSRLRTIHSRVTGDPRRAGSHSEILPASKSPRVLLVTAISPKQCQSPHGDQINLLAAKNKQDYARRHGWDFYLATHLTRSDIGGAWNKVALMGDLLSPSTSDESPWEWLVWMDYDALVVDMEFEVPWTRYIDAGKDFVLWGQDRQLFDEGDAHMGLNTGVFFVRRSDWALKMFKAVLEFGFDNGKRHEEELKVALGKYDWALFDQNGFTHVLRKLQDGRAKTYLEQDFTINGYWRDFPPAKLAALNPFVKHYMGCQFCSGINTADQAVCVADFRKTWTHINDRVARTLNVSMAAA